MRRLLYIGMVLTFLLMELVIRSQSIGCRLLVEPTSTTLISDIREIIEPIYSYKIESISKPYFGIELIRKTKNNWEYGVGMSTWQHDKYISFDYRTPNVISNSSWNELNNSGIYKTSNTAFSFVIGKSMDRFNINLTIGKYGRLNQWRKRLIIDHFGTSIVNITASHTTIRVGGLEVQALPGNEGVGSTLFSTIRLNYELNPKLQIGVSLRWSPQPAGFVFFRVWEYIEKDPDVIFLSVLDEAEKHSVAEVQVYGDMLNLGFSISYEFRKMLIQKRKTARQARKY